MEGKSWSGVLIVGLEDVYRFLGGGWMEKESHLGSVQSVVVDDDNLTKPEPEVKTELKLEAYSPSLYITIY